MKKTPKNVDTTAISLINEVNNLPKNFHLFDGDDSYREGDLIGHQIDSKGSPVSWLQLSSGCLLVKKHMRIIKGVPVWREK